MKVATWNVNSIRVRVDRCLRFLERHEPDVVCLQETKVLDEAFPREAFEAEGWKITSHGQKTYNGVAFLSREEPQDVRRGIQDDEDDDQARVLSGSFRGVRIIDVYVPNGSTVESPKFRYKLRWLERLHDWLRREHRPDQPLMICGDYNIAPDERDVYDPEAWRGKVLFHPDEHAALDRLRDWGLVDAFRLLHEEGEQYTWWDFRGGRFWKNEGLRIDHFLVTAPLAAACREVQIDAWERKGKQPSDHAPVLAVFDEEALASGSA